MKYGRIDFHGFGALVHPLALSLPFDTRDFCDSESMAMMSRATLIVQHIAS